MKTTMFEDKKRSEEESLLAICSKVEFGKGLPMDRELFPVQGAHQMRPTRFPVSIELSMIWWLKPKWNDREAVKGLDFFFNFDWKMFTNSAVPLIFRLKH